MTMPVSQPRRATARDLYFFAHSDSWSTWPFLPVIRHCPDGDMDCGVLYDARGASGAYGYSATVFHSNIFTLPATEKELMALPKEVFDSADELAAAGWRVD